MRPGFEIGGTGKVSEQDHSEAIRYWQSKSPEERLQAILDIRDFYYEVMHPGRERPIAIREYHRGLHLPTVADPSQARQRQASRPCRCRTLEA